MAQQRSMMNRIRKANAAVLTAYSRVVSATKELEMASQQFEKAANELEWIIKQDAASAASRRTA